MKSLRRYEKTYTHKSHIRILYLSLNLYSNVKILKRLILESKVCIDSNPSVTLYILLSLDNCSPSKQPPIDLTTSDSIYLTPRGRGSEDFISSSATRPRAGSLDDRNYDIRRSLRKLGVQPDSYGLPYYASSKQRTPLKMNEDREDEGEGDNDKENGTGGPDNNNNADDAMDTPLVNKTDNVPPPSKLNPKMPGFTDFPRDMMLCLSSVDSSRISTKSSIGSTPHCTPSPPPNKVIVDMFKLSELFDKVVRKTENRNVDACLKIHSVLNHLVFRHRMELNKGKLLEVVGDTCTTIANVDKGLIIAVIM